LFLLASERWCAIRTARLSLLLHIILMAMSQLVLLPWDIFFCPSAGPMHMFLMKAKINAAFASLLSKGFTYATCYGPKWWPANE
jgi:hypothetical protein